MKSLIIIVLLAICINQQIKAQTHLADTLWNHTIEEADLILDVIITNKTYVTERGFFTCKIIRVVKGKCKISTIDLDLELIENSEIRFKNRYDAIMDKVKVRIGFIKASGWYSRMDIEGIEYGFFMSE